MNLLADESVDRQIVRLAGLSPAGKAEIVASAVTRHSRELPGAFAVLTPRSFRIRRL